MCVAPVGMLRSRPGECRLERLISASGEGQAKKGRPFLGASRLSLPGLNPCALAPLEQLDGPRPSRVETEGRTHNGAEDQELPLLRTCRSSVFFVKTLFFCRLVRDETLTRVGGSENPPGSFAPPRCATSVAGGL